MLSPMLKHTLFTWLFTCVTGTLILCLYFGFVEGSMKSSEMELLALIALGITLIASIPAMIFHGILLNSLLRNMPATQVKAIGSGYAIVATAISCFIAFGIITHEHFGSSGALLMLAALPYALCFAAAVWIIPMPLPVHVEIPEEGLAEGPALTTAPPPAYYIVAGMAGIMLLYSFYNLFIGGLRLQGGNLFPHVLLFFVDTGLMATGLILFIRWKSAGWKMLVGLSAGGVIGAAFSFATTMRMLMDHAGMVTGFLGTLVLFFLMDGVSLFLLQRPELRGRFGAAMKDYWVWVLVGVGYAAVRMGVAKVVYGI